MGNELRTPDLTPTSRPARVRTLRESDYPDVISSLDAWWAGRAMAAMLPRLFFKHFQSTSFAAELDERLVGFLVGLRSESQPREAYIHFIGVDPQYRQKGVARTLYDRFFCVALELGCTHVRAVTSPANEASLKFHRRIGFRREANPNDARSEIWRDYDGPGEDRILLLRPLEPVS